MKIWIEIGIIISIGIIIISYLLIVIKTFTVKNNKLFSYTCVHMHLQAHANTPPHTHTPVDVASYFLIVRFKPKTYSPTTTTTILCHHSHLINILFLFLLFQAIVDHIFEGTCLHSLKYPFHWVI